LRFQIQIGGDEQIMAAFAPALLASPRLGVSASPRLFFSVSQAKTAILRASFWPSSADAFADVTAVGHAEGAAEAVLAQDEAEVALAGEAFEVDILFSWRLRTLVMT